MYLLFQQQTTLERAASDNNMWGPFSEDNPSCLKAFSLLRMFGPTTCMVAPDSRAGMLVLIIGGGVFWLCLGQLSVW